MKLENLLTWKPLDFYFTKAAAKITTDKDLQNITKVALKCFATLATVLVVLLPLATVSAPFAAVVLSTAFMATFLTLFLSINPSTKEKFTDKLENIIK